MKNFIFFKINNYIVSYAIYIWYNIFFKFIQQYFGKYSIN